MGEIHIQVCYAEPHAQRLYTLSLPSGATLQSAIEHSGVLRDAPEINLAVCRVGIYGKLKSLDTVLREHDRVEIYRPLIADPKESRRRRAGQKNSAGNR